MSSRVVALTLIISLGAGSGVLAEGPLIQSASRVIQRVEQEHGLLSNASVNGLPSGGRFESGWLAAQQGDRGAATQQASSEPKSHMRTRTKAIILGVLGAGFAASAFHIDHHVNDITPSHLGTRHDGCKVLVFGCN